MEALYILLGLLILGLVAYGIYVYTTDGPKKLFGLHNPMCSLCNYNGGQCYNMYNYGGCPDPTKSCVSCSSLNLGMSNSMQQCPSSWANKAC